MESRKKGKPVTTSVPSISIRFNATAGEIEEFTISDDDEAAKDISSGAEKSESVAGNTDSEGSPLRSYLPRINKRSTSVDVSPSNVSQDASPPSDPWKFFSDIKGKITKSVTEYKGTRSGEGSPKTSKPTEKDSKDNSSLSDSEDISESSISRTCGILSTTEGVEMSSDDETPSLSEKESKPSTSQNTSASEKGKEKRRIRINSVRQVVDLSSEDLEQIHDITTDGDEDIEDGVDVLISGVVEGIENVNSTNDGLNVDVVHGSELRDTFFSTSDDRTVFAPQGFVDLRAQPAPRINYYQTKYIYRSIVVLLVAILFYFGYNFSVYVSGFITGCLLTFLVCFAYYLYLTQPIKEVPAEVFEIPSIKEYAPLTKFEGWMNEYPDSYNPHTYHISQTQSVYLKLQGNLLKVSHTKSKIPKRALWNEPPHKPILTHHRIYNLLGAKITILPEGLARRRRWSKKYPIGITLRPEQLLFTIKEKPSKSVDKKRSNKSIDSQPSINSDFSLNSMKAQDALDLGSLNDEEEVSLNCDSNFDVKTVDSDVMSVNSMVKNDRFLKEDLDGGEWKEDSDEEDSSDTKLYFFGRTDREKEDWFRRFVGATHKGANATKKNDEDANLEDVSDTLITGLKLDDEYRKYMQMFQQARNAAKNHEKAHKTVYAELVREVSTDMFWVNSLLGRILFDCMREDDFTQTVKNRIQRKLSAIKLPYFINELIITELNLGTAPPILHQAGAPTIDDRGLWVDFDITYEGNVVLTLLTKVNLLKLKDKPIRDANKIVEQKNMAMFHSDVDDSAETSSDDDTAKIIASDIAPLDAQGFPIQGLGGTSNSSKKFMRIVDKIAESKMFKAASEYKVVKRLMEDVSNTDLGLKVEIKALSGTLVLNIPPPPSDRVWMSFRPTPKLLLTAFPIVGERNITFMHLTSWIEQKLIQEFHKVLVIPNMEDITVPMMCSTIPH